MSMTAQLVRWGDVFTLRLPSPWLWSEHVGTIGIYQPGGVGALQVSIVSHGEGLRSKGDVALQLAQSFAQQRHWEVAASQIHATTNGINAVTEFEFTEHGDNPTYWQVWHVVGPRRAAFITYTCKPTDANVEANDRRKIVASFRWV
jgi:hypothetical protein